MDHQSDLKSFMNAIQDSISYLFFLGQSHSVKVKIIHMKKAHGPFKKGITCQKWPALSRQLCYFVCMNVISRIWGNAGASKVL